MKTSSLLILLLWSACINAQCLKDATKRTSNYVILDDLEHHVINLVIKFSNTDPKRQKVGVLEVYADFGQNIASLV